MFKYLYSLIKLCKLTVVLALAFTGYVGMLMATHSHPATEPVLILIAILVLSASASAIINNLFDEVIDIGMTRTAVRQPAIELWGRPMLWLVSLLMATGSVVLSAVYFNMVVASLTLAAILSYSVWYTLILKRTSPYGVVPGGIPGALPVLIGAYAGSHHFNEDVWLLFIFMILWQPAHFWTLALKIKDQYAAVNVPILPVVFGDDYTKKFLYLYGAALPPISLAIYYTGNYGLIYLITAIVMGMYFTVQTIRYVHFSEQYRKAFFASLAYMLFIMLGIVVDVII